MIIEILTVRKFPDKRFCLAGVVVESAPRAAVHFILFTRNGRSWSVFSFDAGFMNERLRFGVAVELLGRRWSAFVPSAKKR